jgi:hypothetical protein
MDLSQSFSIDVGAPWVKRHNAQARKVLEAYCADRPIRVPLLCDEAWLQHGFYADEIDLDYREYYTDPDEMLRVQLEAARRKRELPMYDFILGETPESWPITVDLWPTPAPGWVGCELLYRRDAVIAHRGLNLGKEACRQMAMPDPRTGGILKTYDAFWTYLRERYEGNLQFLGQPVRPILPGVDIAGPFSLALDIRGAEIMRDMYEDSEFAEAFLLKMAIWCDVLQRTWCELAGRAIGPFSTTDHGIDMLSPQLYEAFLIPIIFEMNRRRGTRPSQGVHHCGRGVQLFPVMKRHFGLKRIHALTFPLVDVARVQAELGDDSQIMAVIEDSIVKLGPPERIRQTVMDLLESGVKDRGRFALIVGDMLKGTPVEHRFALYESVKEFGGYQ